MIALGLALFPLFILYEARYPAKPVVPVKWFKRAPVLGACAIGFLDFVSFYLQYTYLYPYVPLPLSALHRCTKGEASSENQGLEAEELDCMNAR